MINNKIILAIDFDDTLSKNNVAREILRKYLQKDYQNILNKYLNGNLSFREYQEFCFLSWGLNISEIIEEAKNTGIIRDGFFELLDLIHSFNGEVVIVSAGLQNYIKPVLQKSGLNDLEIFSIKELSNILQKFDATAYDPEFHITKRRLIRSIEIIHPDNKNINNQLIDKK